MDVAFIQRDEARGCAGVCHVCDTDRALTEGPHSPRIDLVPAVCIALRQGEIKTPNLCSLHEL